MDMMKHILNIFKIFFFKSASAIEIEIMNGCMGWNISWKVIREIPTNNFPCLQVSVVEITSIGFGETRKEAIEGTKLVMNLQLYGEAPDGSIVPVTDCR